MEKITLCPAEILDIEKTFECGQCFRWNKSGDGVYTGVDFSYPATVFYENDSVCVKSDAPRELWESYFDLGRDYKAISDAFCGGEYLKTCCEYGFGIRILQQDRWEALCSFIISQCNNISRIKGIVERLCALCGEKIEFDGREYYTFPSAAALSKMTAEELAPIRSGYRAEYIIAAAEAVYSGELDLEALSVCNYKDAVKALRSVKGIGEKVANCAVLFGLGHMEAFPIDVWMKRALKENFPENFDPETLGEFAGLAQQYIFYYARSMGK